LTSAADERIALVVTGQGDLACDMVVAELGRLGANVVRLDLAAGFHHLDCVLRDGVWHGTITTPQGRTVALQAVGSVLWRWPGQPAGHPALDDQAERAWGATQDTEAVFGVLKSLPVRWMNHPDRTAAASSKAVQLRDAARVGLPVPRTLIATHGSAVESWMTPGGQHIYKAFKAPFRPGGVIVPATRVTPQEVPGELLAASMFQPLVHGVPIRATVVGDGIFAVRVEGDFAVDWRPTQTEAVLTPVVVPVEAHRGIHSLMRLWGLTYGAFDFIADGDGRWWFLENNCAGQFGFVELKTGLGIAGAIAAWLTR
jgi:hypothetical protein